MTKDKLITFAVALFLIFMLAIVLYVAVIEVLTLIKPENIGEYIGRIEQGYKDATDDKP